MAELPYGGAYGLQLPQLGTSDFLVPAPAQWQPWSLVWSDEPAARPWSWSAELAVLPVQPNGRALIDRTNSVTTLHRAPRADDALLHPYLGTTALAAAAWSGRLGLHAGVIARHGRAWGLLGDRGAGKSSTLMWWLKNAGRVLADDLLITDGRVVMTGPRFIDLRAGAAKQYSAGTDVGVLGTRRRWRVPTGAAEPETQLAGVIELSWGTRVEISPIRVTDRFDVLYRYRGLNFPVEDGHSVLRSLALPAYRFVRPREWQVAEDALSRLVEHLDAIP